MHSPCSEFPFIWILALPSKDVMFLADNPTGRLAEGGRIRNGERSMKKVRFLGWGRGGCRHHMLLPPGGSGCECLWWEVTFSHPRPLSACLILWITSVFSTNQISWSPGPCLHLQSLPQWCSTYTYLKNEQLLSRPRKGMLVGDFQVNLENIIKVCFLQATVLETLRLYLTPDS